MGAELTILVPARDEEKRVGATVAALASAFPEAKVVVADDGSRDRTAAVAEAAGAIVLRLARLGKGQALSAAERAAGPGRVLLVDADLDGDVTSLLRSDADVAVAVFASRQGGGLRRRQANRPLARSAALGLRCARAAVGPARALAGRQGGVLPARPGVRL